MNKGILLIIGIVLSLSGSLFISVGSVYGLSKEGEHDQYRDQLGITSMKGWKSPKRAVWTVQDWKLKIYLKHGVDLTTFLTLEAISQTECGDSLGFCKSGADVGPFQINSSKGSYYLDSLDYLRKKDYNSLFAFQVRWTLDYHKRNSHWCDGSDSIESYVRCQAVIHNGNNAKTCDGRERKYCYADRVRAMREVLKKHYLNKWEKIKKDLSK